MVRDPHRTHSKVCLVPRPELLAQVVLGRSCSVRGGHRSARGLPTLSRTVDTARASVLCSGQAGLLLALQRCGHCG